MNTMAIIGFLALLDIILIVLTPDPKLKLLLGAMWFVLSAIAKYVSNKNKDDK